MHPHSPTLLGAVSTFLFNTSEPGPVFSNRRSGTESPFPGAAVLNRKSPRFASPAPELRNETRSLTRHFQQLLKEHEEQDEVPNHHDFKSLSRSLPLPASPVSLRQVSASRRLGNGWSAVETEDSAGLEQFASCCDSPGGGFSARITPLSKSSSAESKALSRSPLNSKAKSSPPPVTESECESWGSETESGLAPATLEDWRVCLGLEGAVKYGEGQGLSGSVSAAGVTGDSASIIGRGRWSEL